MGRTVHREPLRAFTHLSVDDDAPIEDGAVSHDGAIVGTYVHGLFGDDVLRAAFVRAARARAGLTPATAFVAYTAEREARIDRLAAHVRAALDIDALLGSASRA